MECSINISHFIITLKNRVTIYKCSTGGKEKKEKILIKSYQQRIIGKSLYSSVFYESNTLINISFGGLSIFFTQWFYILNVFNMERYLACLAFLIVFINQDHQYQQNKQKVNIMIKHKWDMKEHFQRYNTNEKHKTIVFFFPEWFLCSHSIFPN